ncbi:hypothetical protein E2C01_087693 [Portunus trituberculatus]|uniref:Uncharacterized protein n=1 Tax=Portunus trituberculatus TaxID=210409 RepID=A0A5B7JER4_PORTR|nr:hypothetical protein [Portunus trituberculatus]
MAMAMRLSYLWEDVRRRRAVAVVMEPDQSTSLLASSSVDLGTAQYLAGGEPTPHVLWATRLTKSNTEEDLYVGRIKRQTQQHTKILLQRQGRSRIEHV